MTGPTVTCKVSFRTAQRRTATPNLEQEPKHPDSATLARRLALAYLIERLIDQGQLRDYAHAAIVLGVSRARVTQIVDLSLLPSDQQGDMLVDAPASSHRKGATAGA